MNNHDALKELTEDICARSDGIPGAITVMCAGVLACGRSFFTALERSGLRGAEIWRVYKDECGSDFDLMLLRLLATPMMASPLATQDTARLEQQR